MSTPAVLLAAPGTVVSSVRDVLRDWVALGLVQPFLWVEADEIDPGTPLAQVVATYIQGAHAPRVRLQDFLADQRSLDAPRLVLVGTAGAQTSVVPADIARTLETPLRTLLPGRVIALQCVLPLQGSGGWVPGIAIPGWQTLVLAPEDSWSPSPTQPSTEFTVGGDRSEHTSHAAAGVAAVSGLWAGIDTGPFDVDDQGSDPLAVRAFLRRLDASQVTSALRSSLMDVSGGLPRPQTSQGRCEHLQDPVGAANQVIGAIGTRHADLFTLDLLSTSTQARQAIGAWAAVKMFFSFLAGVVSRAPGALIDRSVSGTATAVSGQVQQALFGEDSRYEVVTRGLNAQGLPAGARDLALAAQDVRSRLARVLPSEPVMPDVSDLWTSVVYGALTLADGGERTPDVGPVLIGGKAGVVRETAQIAPAPDAAFPLPPSVSSRVGTPSVSPYDVLQHEAIATAMAGSGNQDPEVTRTGEQYVRWRQRVTTSYTGILGQRLAGDLTHRQQLLRSLLEKLQSQQQAVDADAVAAQRVTARLLLLRFVVGLLVLAAVVGIVKYFKLLGDLALVGLAVALLVAWTVGHVLAAVQVQRRIFALIHANRERQDELEVAARNVPVVANALFLATTLYEQYLQWAPVLGRFLQQPFGSPVEARPAARLEGLLPRAVGFGVVQPEQEQIAVVAHQLSTTVFERGWLSPLWQALVDDAPQRLGPAGLALRESPLALWNDTARAEDSLLRRWSNLVAAHGVERGAGDALWSRARSTLLARGTAELTSSLLTSVEVQAQQAHGIRDPITGREFFTRLTDALGDLDRHYFTPSLFTPQAQSQDVHRVARTVAFGRPDVAALGASASSSTITWMPPTENDEGSLDQFLVVVQSSRSAPATSFTLRGGDDGGAQPGPASSTVRPPDLPDLSG